MPEFVQCDRCGRRTTITVTSFISWHVTADGKAICPHCLTPSETVDDDTAVLTDSPDDELLRELDPDNQGDDGR